MSQAQVCLQTGLPLLLSTVLSGLHFSDGEIEATRVSWLTCPLTTGQSSGDQFAPPRTQLNPEPADSGASGRARLSPGWASAFRLGWESKLEPPGKSHGGGWSSGSETTKMRIRCSFTQGDTVPSTLGSALGRGGVV